MVRHFLKAKKKLFIMLALFAVIFCGIFAAMKIKSADAETLGNGSRVDENAELTYYLHVKYDGINREGIASSDDTSINVISNEIIVTDRIPDGLIFQGFETTADGTIGSALRADPSVGCSGVVIDDTQEDNVDDGTWDGSNYYYHGLHYSEETRTVSFRVSALQAGCQLNVGIKAKTPELTNTARMDFYNHANALERTIDAISNTVHVWMGRDDVPTYTVSYRYDGNVPDGAPALPADESYARGETVVLAQIPTLSGYSFEGWNVAEGGIELSGDSFSMPGNDVVLTGTFIESQEEQFDVSYVIEGESPKGYRAPKTKSYRKGDIVTVDSLASGATIDDYTFDGWDTSSLDVSDSTFAMPNSDVTIRGAFDRDEYEVRYVYVGDVPANAPALPETRNYHTGDFVEVAAKPSLAGYTFYGWSRDDFYIEDADVEITGAFIRDIEYFQPNVEIQITNPADKYKKDETVLFDITITNDEDFDLFDIALQELLDGAVFVGGENYTLRSDTVVMIPSLPAHESITVKAKFDVAKNDDNHFDNTVKVISAFSEEHSFNPDGCEATVGFDTEKVGGTPIDDIIDNPETLESIGKAFGIIVLVGAIAFVVIVLNKKLSRRNKTFLRNGGIAVVAVAMISFGSIVIFKKVFATVDNEAVYKSSNMNYDAGDIGAWKLTSTASLVDEDVAKVNLKIESVAKRSQNPRDVLIVFGDGCEMRAGVNNGDLLYAIGDYYKNIVNYAADDILNANDANRIGVISFDEDNQRFSLPFSRDAQGVKDAVAPIPGLSSHQCNDTYFNISRDKEPALKKAEEYLADYTPQEGRDLYIMYLSESLHWFSLARTNDEQRDYVARYQQQYNINQLEYDILKANHPNLTINTIGLNGVYRTLDDQIDRVAENTLRQVGEYREATSDNYYSYDLDWFFDNGDIIWLKDGEAINTFDLYDKNFSFEPFELKQTLDDRYFELLDGRRNATVSSDNPNTIIWTPSREVRSGRTYEYDILVKFKDGYASRDDDTYPIFSKTEIKTGIKDVIHDERTVNEDVTSRETPYVKNKYTVTYRYNMPDSCSLPNDAVTSEKRNAFSTVEYPEAPKCEGWLFGGYNAVSEDQTTSYGGDYFRMPESNATVAASWKKLSIEKSMDGTLFSSAAAYLVTGDNFLRHLAALYTESASFLTTTSYIPYYNFYITSIQRAEELPNDLDTDNPIHLISLPDSVPVYMWAGPYYACPDRWGRTVGCKDVYYYTTANQIYLNEDSSRLLYDMEYLRDISGLKYFDASKVENLTSFMYNNYMATDISALSTWNTPNLKNLDGAWSNTYSLQSLDGLQNFDTSNVTYMRNTFNGVGHDAETGFFDASAISGWDVSKVEDMYCVFNYSGEFDTNALKYWNTASLTNLESTFSSSSIKNVDGLINWDTSKVESLYNTFAGSSITNVDGLVDWNVSSVENMNSIFNEAKSLENLDGLANWETSNVKSLSHAFSHTDSLTNIDGLEGWDVSNVEDMSALFEYSGIQNVNGLASWNVISVKEISSAFKETPNLSDVSGLANWYMPNVKSYLQLFMYAESLRDISPLANWDTSNVTDFKSVFCSAGVSSFAPLATKTVTVDGRTYTAWDVSNVTNMHQFATSTANLEDLTGLEDWDTSSLKDLGNAFRNSGIKNVDAMLNWDVSNVTSLWSTFESSAIENVDGLRNWQLSPNLTQIYSTFQWAHSLTDISGLENWDVSNVKALNYTFYGSGITSLEPLHDWEPNLSTSGWQPLGRTFAKTAITSTKGIEKFHVENVDYLYATFEEIPTLKTLGGVEDGVKVGLKAWEDKVYNVKRIERVFYNDTGLEDVTALSGWRLGNPITTDFKSLYGVPTTATGYYQTPSSMR